MNAPAKNAFIAIARSPRGGVLYVTVQIASPLGAFYVVKRCSAALSEWDTAQVYAHTAVDADRFLGETVLHVADARRTAVSEMRRLAAAARP